MTSGKKKGASDKLPGRTVWLPRLILGLVSIGLIMVIVMHWHAAWRLNVSNLQFVRWTTEQAACPVALQPLAICLPGNDPLLARDRSDFTPCQLEWISRAEAAQSLNRAELLHEQAEPCQHQDMLVVWGATLAWFQGNQVLAAQRLSQLGASKLLALGNVFVQAGQLELGQIALETVTSVYAADFSPDFQAKLYFYLGNMYKQQLNWAKAAEAYDRARQIGPDNLEVLFPLGESLRRSGQPMRSAQVLENGRSYLEGQYNWLAPAYLTQLGLAYMDAGDTRRALAVLKEAREVMVAQNASVEQQQFVSTLIQKLNSVP